MKTTQILFANYFFLTYFINLIIKFFPFLLFSQLYISFFIIFHLIDHPQYLRNLHHLRIHHYLMPQYRKVLSPLCHDHFRLNQSHNRFKQLHLFLLALIVLKIVVVFMSNLKLQEDDPFLYDFQLFIFLFQYKKLLLDAVLA